MKIKFGSIVVDGSGKLGGHIYAKNRGGNYVRTKVTPTNPQTIYQMQVRGLFGNLSSQWRSLTEMQRTSWENYAGNNEVTDAFGDKRRLAGNAMFVSINTNLSLANMPVLLTPVNVEERIIAVVGGLTATSGTPDVLRVEFDDYIDGAAGDGKIVVYATEPFRASQKYAKNKFRYLGAYDTDAVDTFALDIETEYTGRFGALVEGMRVSVQLAFLKSDGTTTPLGSVSTVIS